MIRCANCNLRVVRTRIGGTVWQHVTGWTVARWSEIEACCEAGAPGEMPEVEDEMEMARR